MQGPVGTPYENLSFRLLLNFTSEYPFKPPVVKFDTPCFHPNVDTHGNICLDILKEKWSGEGLADEALQPPGAVSHVQILNITVTYILFPICSCI